MSAESELGTLPVSAFSLRWLHTRSGLGRSAVVLRRTHRYDAPLSVPAHRTPWDTVPLDYPVVTRRARVPSERTATSPAAAPPPLDAPRHAPPDMPHARSRADRSDPSPPHAQLPVARRGHAQPCKIDEHGERARQTPRQLIVVKGAAHPKRTRPLRRYYAAPAATMCLLRYPRTVPHGMGYPLSTPQSHCVQGFPPRVPQQAFCRTAIARCPRHASPDMPRARSRADRSDPPRPHTQKRRWQEGGAHSVRSFVSAESELGTLPFSLLL
jgi:hypothetical protein